MLLGTHFTAGIGVADNVTTLVSFHGLDSVNID